MMRQPTRKAPSRSTRELRACALRAPAVVNLSGTTTARSRRPCRAAITSVLEVVDYGAHGHRLLRVLADRDARPDLCADAPPRRLPFPDRVTAAQFEDSASA